MGELENVGLAGEMPGSNGGFTMAAFKASSVPIGTALTPLAPAQAEIERLKERVRVLSEALEEAAGNQALHYLRAAHRHLETISEAMPGEKGLSLGNLALADTRDWLDCHIDWLERTVPAALQPKGEADE